MGGWVQGCHLRGRSHRHVARLLQKMGSLSKMRKITTNFCSKLHAFCNLNERRDCYSKTACYFVQVMMLAWTTRPSPFFLSLRTTCHKVTFICSTVNFIYSMFLPGFSLTVLLMAEAYFGLFGPPCGTVFFKIETLCSPIFGSQHCMYLRWLV